MNRWGKLAVVLGGISAAVFTLSAYQPSRHVSARFTAKKLAFTSVTPFAFSRFRDFHRLTLRNLPLALHHVEVAVASAGGKKEAFGDFRIRPERPDRGMLIPVWFTSPGTELELRLAPGSTCAISVARGGSPKELSVWLFMNGRVTGSALTFKKMELRAQENAGVEGSGIPFTFFRELVASASDREQGALESLPGKEGKVELLARMLPRFQEKTEGGELPAGELLVAGVEAREVELTAMEGSLSLGRTFHKIRPNDLVRIPGKVILREVSLHGDVVSFTLEGEVSSILFNQDDLVDSLLELVTGSPQWSVFGAAFFVILSEVLKGIIEKKKRRVTES